METIDITPDTQGLIRFAKRVLKESPTGSKSASAALKILAECGVKVTD